MAPQTSPRGAFRSVSYPDPDSWFGGISCRFLRVVWTPAVAHKRCANSSHDTRIYLPRRGYVPCMCPVCCSNIGRCPRAGQDLCAPSTISPNIRCPCSGTHLASLPYLAASALPRCMYNGRFVQHAARLCHCRYPEAFQRVDPWLNGMIYPPTAACLPCGVRDRRSGLTIVVLRRVR